MELSDVLNLLILSIDQVFLMHDFIEHFNIVYMLILLRLCMNNYLRHVRAN